MTRLAYFDLYCGTSGDMTLAALVDAGVPLDALNAAIGSLGLPGLRLHAAEVRKQGFRAMQVTVEAATEHVHRNLGDILALVDAGRLSDRQRETARRIFTRLAEAEARVHGVEIDEVHFHEVGAADSIADIVGAAVGFDLLGVDRVVASPVPTGHGRVRIAHGEFSIPAPATAELLRGIPLADADVEGELVTPTGAAILTSLVGSFGPMPAMVVDRIGCGAGKNDFAPRANILRLFVGEAVESAAADDGETDQACLIETNLDDLAGELIGYCIERLWDAGALDVFATPIQMKKNRPGGMLSVLCRPGDMAVMETILLTETTTLGVRRSVVGRRVLPRQPHRVSTPWGTIEGKAARLPDGSWRFSPEFEACRRVAIERGVALMAVYEAARKAFNAADVGNS